VEIRARDVCLYTDDDVLTAGLVRTLAETAARARRHGLPPRPVPAASRRLALGRVSRPDNNDDLLHPVDNRPQPAPEIIETLLSHARAALIDSGDLHRVRSGLAAIMRLGTGEGQQHATHALKFRRAIRCGRRRYPFQPPLAAAYREPRRRRDPQHWFELQKRSRDTRPPIVPRPNNRKPAWTWSSDRRAHPARIPAGLRLELPVHEAGAGGYLIGAALTREYRRREGVRPER